MSTLRLPQVLLRYHGVWLGAALGWATVSSCVTTSEPAEAPVARTTGVPIQYDFPPVGDDVSVSSESMRGRVTALLFITTYDLASQLFARRLADVVTSFTPRANAAAVVVEPPLYADLLPAYRDALSLPFPIVMADYATQQGGGPFGSVTRVPLLIVLDREGREVSRHQGSLEPQQIEAALRQAGQRQPPS
jgi:hypothetical protein